MSNPAHIVEGPKGTPSQAFWDGLINGIENCPNVDTINKYVKKLTDSIDKMNKAISEYEKEIYDATIKEFNDTKQEILNYLNDSKQETQDRINELIEDKVEGLEDTEADLAEEIADLTAENTAGVPVQTPPAGDLASLTAWAANVSTWATAQKTSVLNTIKRIKKKYDPIVSAVAWWPTTITQLTTYIGKRIGKITDAITSITNITPPSYPSIPT